MKKDGRRAETGKNGAFNPEPFEPEKPAVFFVEKYAVGYSGSGEPGAYPCW